MKPYHWVVSLVVIVLAYYAGAHGWFGKVTSAVKGAAGAGA